MFLISEGTFRQCDIHFFCYLLYVSDGNSTACVVKDHPPKNGREHREMSGPSSCCH